MKTFSPPAPASYSIKGTKQWLFKIFCIIFLSLWLCTVALMIATLCYNNFWALITAFVLTTVTVVLPISILIERNFLYLIYFNFIILLNFQKYDITI